MADTRSPLSNRKLNEQQPEDSMKDVVKKKGAMAFEISPPKGKQMMPKCLANRLSGKPGAKKSAAASGAPAPSVVAKTPRTSATDNSFASPIVSAGQAAAAAAPAAAASGPKIPSIARRTAQEQEQQQQQFFDDREQSIVIDQSSIFAGGDHQEDDEDDYDHHDEAAATRLSNSAIVKNVFRNPEFRNQYLMSDIMEQHRRAEEAVRAQEAQMPTWWQRGGALVVGAWTTMTSSAWSLCRSIDTWLDASKSGDPTLKVILIVIFFMLCNIVYTLVRRWWCMNYSPTWCY